MVNENSLFLPLIRLWKIVMKIKNDSWKVRYSQFNFLIEQKTAVLIEKVSLLNRFIKCENKIKKRCGLF